MCIHTVKKPKLKKKEKSSKGVCDSTDTAKTNIDYVMLHTGKI